MTGTTNGGRSDLQIAAIKSVLCDSSVYSNVSLLKVAVIQFSSYELTKVEIYPTVVNPGLPGDPICALINSIDPLGGVTELAIGLEMATHLFQEVGPTFARELIVMTDSGIDDWTTSFTEANNLRSMKPPVRICAALVTENQSDCGQLSTYVNMNELANTLVFDPNGNCQPTGKLYCLQADVPYNDIEGLCSVCLEFEPNSHWALGDDCNGNDVLDECEDVYCPGDVSGEGGVPDGDVNVTDLLAIIANWGQPCSLPSCLLDIDLSGIVDVGDLLAVIGNWGCGFDPCAIMPQSIQDCLDRYPLGSQKLERCIEYIEFIIQNGN